MIQCDLFDAHVHLDGRTLRWSVATDLPGGTRMIVDCSRLYTDTSGRPSVWVLTNFAVLLTNSGPGDFNGASGVIDVNEGDSHGLARFNQLLGAFSSGIATPVEKEVRIEFTVGARQPMKAFGKYNCNLSGGMVQHSGDINIIHHEAVLPIEMRPENQPIEQ